MAGGSPTGATTAATNPRPITISPQALAGTQLRAGAAEAVGEQLLLLELGAFDMLTLIIGLRGHVVSPRHGNSTAERRTSVEIAQNALSHGPGWSITSV